MQALILAAGVGRRLRPLTDDRTKGMVELHGRSLLARSLDALVDHGVERIVLVVGHHADGVRTAFGERHRGVPVTYVVNADHATTNNIHSLHLAAEEFARDDTLLLESDLVFDPGLIGRLLAHPSPDVVTVAAAQPWMDGTMVTLAPDERIEAFVPGHRVDPGSGEEYFKTVNIYKFSRDFIVEQYLPFLAAYVRSAGRHEYYEQVLRVIAGLDHSGLVGMPVDRERWYEIDDLQDYRIAETLFAPPAERYDRHLARHGGYWRFPHLLDFCYLVNPWFPTRELREDLDRSFHTLLASYPSSAAVQAQLAADLCGGDPDCFLVGNGAAELITALGAELGACRVGVTLPTFEEYRTRFPEAHVVTERAGGPDFDTGLAHFLRLLDRVDVLVVVNPDNPTGRCLSVGEVDALLARADADGKRVILDESFVDFADPHHCTSLLRQDVLDAHPSVVVLKSISKSYGVPGARLGILATSDVALRDRVARRLPVWNVNSFGEYFLQAAGRHRTAYDDACAELRAERDRLAKALAAIPGLRVVPSHANYLLCALPAGHDAHDTATRLLDAYDVLVKDCSAKPGFEGRGGHLRVAVRGPEDNDVLVGALRDVLGASAAR